MNRIIITIILIFIVTIAVVTTQPKQNSNEQYTYSNSSTANKTLTKSVETNAQNISAELSDIKEKKEKKETNIKNINNIDRNTYMSNIRARAERNNIDEVEEHLTNTLFVNKNVTQQSSNTVEKKTTQTKNKTLSAAKIETIQWDKWNTNIAYDILRKADSYCDFRNSVGIIYEISFTVDNNKNISNVNIKINHKPAKILAEPSYNAIQKAISKINGTDILSFPSNTSKTKAEFKITLNIEDWK